MEINFKNVDEVIALAKEREYEKLRNYMAEKGYEFVREVEALMYMGLTRGSEEKMTAIDSFEDYKRNLREEKDIFAEIDHMLSKSSFGRALENGTIEIKAELGL